MALLAGLVSSSANAQSTVPLNGTGSIYGNQGIVTQDQTGNNYLSSVPPNTAIGTVINGQGSISVMTGSGQSGPVVGGETNMTVCPNAIGPEQSAIGTYVGPGSSLHVTVTDNGGSGPVTGYRSSVTVGGSGCP